MIAALVIALSLVDVQCWSEVGVYPHCPLHNRFTYTFFHAGLLHAALNAWCLLSVVFIYSISWRRLIAAYIVAVAVPVNALSCLIQLDTPAVGLSVAVYFLFGSLSFEVVRKRYYQGWMLVYLAMGFLMTAVAAWLHLYAYLVGLLVACIQKPFTKKHTIQPRRGDIHVARNIESNTASPSTTARRGDIHVARQTAFKTATRVKNKPDQA